MNMNFVKITQPVTRFVKKNSSEILLGLGITGFITAGVMMIPATLKTKSCIDEKEDELDRELTKMEIVKEAAPHFVPPIGIAVASTACLIGSHSVDMRRNAALATAYSVTKTSLEEWQNRTEEVVGPEKTEEIRGKVDESNLHKNPVCDENVILTSGGNYLCFDTYTGRYFRSDRNAIKHAENIINRVMIDEMSVSLNTFYAELGLPAVRMGDELGWSMEDQRYVEAHISSMVADNGEPCLVISFPIVPKQFGY